jgi:hypothetical protein
MKENTKSFDVKTLSSILNITSRPVLCKDGTTQNQEYSPNAVVMDACRNNGGKAVNQPVPTTTQESTNNTDVTPQTFLQKNKTNLLIVGALVLGYFAYKKYKK